VYTGSKITIECPSEIDVTASDIIFTITGMGAG